MHVIYIVRVGVAEFSAGQLTCDLSFTPGRQRPPKMTRGEDGARGWVRAAAATGADGAQALPASTPAGKLPIL
jgi:hypothetical protein